MPNCHSNLIPTLILIFIPILIISILIPIPIAIFIPFLTLIPPSPS